MCWGIRVMGWLEGTGMHPGSRVDWPRYWWGQWMRAVRSGSMRIVFNPKSLAHRCKACCLLSSLCVTCMLPVPCGIHSTEAVLVFLFHVHERGHVLSASAVHVLQDRHATWPDVCGSYRCVRGCGWGTWQHNGTFTMLAFRLVFPSN